MRGSGPERFSDFPLTRFLQREPADRGTGARVTAGPGGEGPHRVPAAVRTGRGTDHAALRHGVRRRLSGRERHWVESVENFPGRTTPQTPSVPGPSRAVCGMKW